MVLDPAVDSDALPAVGHRRGESQRLRHGKGIRLNAPRGESDEMPVLLQKAERFPGALRHILRERLGERAVYIKKK